ncbi:hypothetical protein ACNKHM_12115 [Shigella sonnei]
MTRFTYWLAEIQRLAEREPIAAVRILLTAWIMSPAQPNIALSPKAAEMRMKNVATNCLAG